MFPDFPASVDFKNRLVCLKSTNFNGGRSIDGFARYLSIGWAKQLNFLHHDIHNILFNKHRSFETRSKEEVRMIFPDDFDFIQHNSYLIAMCCCIGTSSHCWQLQLLICCMPRILPRQQQKIEFKNRLKVDFKVDYLDLLDPYNEMGIEQQCVNGKYFTPFYSVGSMSNHDSNAIILLIKGLLSKNLLHLVWSRYLTWAISK